MQKKVSIHEFSVSVGSDNFLKIKLSDEIDGLRRDLQKSLNIVCHTE